MTGPMLAREMGFSRRLLPAPSIPVPGLAIGGAIGLAIMVLLGIVGEALAHQHSAAAQVLLPPASPGHPLGTDEGGRDVLARTLQGVRWSLAVALPGAAIAALVGTVLGLTAAANAGWVRAGMERLAETAAGFPFLVLAAPIIALVGRGYWSLVVVLALLSSAPFAQAAFESTWGAPRPIPVVAALHSVLTALPVVAAFLVADLVVAEACLSFLGAGASGSTASIGTMLADAEGRLAKASWMLYTPAVALLLTVVSMNWLGEGLGQLWRPRGS